MNFAFNSALPETLSLDYWSLQHKYKRQQLPWVSEAFEKEKCMEKMSCKKGEGEQQMGE